MPSVVEIEVSMTVDLDGAPNAYGPKERNKECLDDESSAHDQKTGAIVGYLTESDGKTPVIQKAGDPFPGLYVSESAYQDVKNKNREDPRRYVNATEINYVVLASKAKKAGVQPGDFVVVHSKKTRFTVYAIVGDTGHSSGGEGSVALLKRLGYKGRIDGRSGPDMEKDEIVVRYFPTAGANTQKRFFFLQAELDAAAAALGLDTDFSKFHPKDGDPGKLVFAAPGHDGGDTPATSGGTGPQPLPAPAKPVLKSALLRNDPVMDLIAHGHGTLHSTVSASGQEMAATGLLQDALNLLAKNNPAFGIDVGAFRGRFGPKTEKALAAFQAVNGLPPGGELDEATVTALDKALVAAGA